jgi:transcriptional regulator with XRE-family HTH domain
MARTALDMSVKDLAASASVSTNTLVRFERGEELKPRTISAIRSALESAGIIFINGDYQEPVAPVFVSRLRQPNARLTASHDESRHALKRFELTTRGLSHVAGGGSVPSLRIARYLR